MGKTSVRNGEPKKKSFEGDARHTIDLHEVAKKDQTKETSILLINLESFFSMAQGQDISLLSKISFKLPSNHGSLLLGL